MLTKFNFFGLFFKASLTPTKMSLAIIRRGVLVIYNIGSFFSGHPVFITIFTALLSIYSFHAFVKVVERLGKAYTEKVNSFFSCKEAALEG